MINFKITKQFFPNNFLTSINIIFSYKNNFFHTWLKFVKHIMLNSNEFFIFIFFQNKTENIFPTKSLSIILWVRTINFMAFSYELHISSSWGEKDELNSKAPAIVGGRNSLSLSSSKQGVWCLPGTRRIVNSIGCSRHNPQ